MLRRKFPETDEAMLDGSKQERLVIPRYIKSEPPPWRDSEPKVKPYYSFLATTFPVGTICKVIHQFISLSVGYALR